MRSEAEQDSPKLPLFSSMSSISHTLDSTEDDDEPSGYATPPFYSSVSVPFRWEEEPGKPRPCTALVTIPTSNPDELSPKSLELPPRLLLETKLLSPTTVLEGPYSLGRSRFQSSSFRIVGRDCYGSNVSPEHDKSSEKVCSALVVSKTSSNSNDKDNKGWFDSLGRRVLKGKRDNGGANYVFSSSVDGESDGVGDLKVKNTRHRRAKSFSGFSHSKPHFWATIYQGFKQVVPWKGKKSKQDGLMI